MLCVKRLNETQFSASEEQIKDEIWHQMKKRAIR